MRELKKKEKRAKEDNRVLSDLKTCQNISTLHSLPQSLKPNLMCVKFVEQDRLFL